MQLPTIRCALKLMPSAVADVQRLHRIATALGYAQSDARIGTEGRVSAACLVPLAQRGDKAAADTDLKEVKQQGRTAGCASHKDKCKGCPLLPRALLNRIDRCYFAVDGVEEFTMDDGTFIIPPPGKLQAARHQISFRTDECSHSLRSVVSFFPPDSRRPGFSRVRAIHT